MKKDTEKISKGPTFFGHGAVPRTEGHVSLELNILDLTVIDDILLLQVRMTLVLQDRNFVFLNTANNLFQLREVEVGDTNALDQAFINQSFHVIVGFDKVAIHIVAIG